LKVKNVLLIDDNDIDTFINKHVISRCNIADSIITKNSASAALDYLKNGLQNSEDFPEIIFLDIKMPEIDGFGFLERYNELKDEKKYSCTIIMLTSSSDNHDIERAMNNPFVKKYLNKPLQAGMLSDILEIVHH
jgi:CheY-like chemotaxis protein